MQRASYGDRCTITVMAKGKHVVFDFTSKVIDFFTVFSKPEDGKDASDNPEALVVLAEEEIVAIDLNNPEWKMMALPYLVSLHASAVNSNHSNSAIYHCVYVPFLFTVFVISLFAGHLFATRTKCFRRIVGKYYCSWKGTNGASILG